MRLIVSQEKRGQYPYDTQKPVWWIVYTAVLETALRNGMSARCRPQVQINEVVVKFGKHIALKMLRFGLRVQVPSSSQKCAYSLIGKTPDYESGDIVSSNLRKRSKK